MRTEGNNVFIEYTDMLLVISTYIRRFKFTNNNQMPDTVVIEVPYQAWDLKTETATACDSYQVDGDPPAQWFKRAVRHDLQQAPEVEAAQVTQSVPEPSNPPMTPMNTDEMVVVVGEAKERVTPKEPPVRRPEPQGDQSIMHMSGEIEDFNLDVRPIEEALKEETIDGTEGSVDTIPSGHERTEEHDRLAEAIGELNIDAPEPDGNE